MNLFALVKDPQPNVRRVAVSQQLSAEIATLFEAQEASFLGVDPEFVGFDGNYTPEEDEILEITNFAVPANLLAALQDPIDCPEFRASDVAIATLRGFALAKASRAGAPKILLQKFDQRRAITTRGFTLWHSGQTFKKLEGVALTLDDRLTATLDGTRLRFRSFFAIRQLFDMANYYAEATDPDLAKFQRHSRISLPDGVNLRDLADSWVRRRVAMISESKILDHVKPKQLAAAAVGFPITITIKRIGTAEKIILPTEKKQLKSLLQFLAEDFLLSPLSDAKFLTNSKRRIQ